MGGGKAVVCHPASSPQSFEDKGVGSPSFGPGRVLSQHDSPLIVAKEIRPDSISLVLDFIFFLFFLSSVISALILRDLSTSALNGGWSLARWTLSPGDCSR